MEDDRIKKIKRFLEDELSEDKRTLFLQEAEKNTALEKNIKLIALTEHLLTADHRKTDKAKIAQWQKKVKKRAQKRKIILIVLASILVAGLVYLLAFYPNKPMLSPKEQAIFALYQAPVSIISGKRSQQEIEPNTSLSVIRLKAHQAFTDKDFEKAKINFEYLLSEIYLKEEAEWMILLCDVLSKTAWTKEQQAKLDELRYTSSHPYQEKAQLLYQLVR